GVPLHTLRIKVLNDSGQPAHPGQCSFVHVMNAGDLKLANAEVPVSNGLAQVRVPAGDYSQFTVCDDKPLGRGDFKMVTLNDFKVPAIALVARVTADERTATSPVSVPSPRRVVRDVTFVSVVRFDASGNRTFDGFGAFLAEVPAIPPMFVNAQ